MTLENHIRDNYGAICLLASQNASLNCGACPFDTTSNYRSLNNILTFFKRFRPGFKGKDGITQLSEKYIAGILKLDKIISHTMPLDKINEAFDLMHAGKRFVQLFDTVAINCLRYWASELYIDAEFMSRPY